MKSHLLSAAYVDGLVIAKNARVNSSRTTLTQSTKTGRPLYAVAVWRYSLRGHSSRTKRPVNDIRADGDESITSTLQMRWSLTAQFTLNGKPIELMVIVTSHLRPSPQRSLGRI